MHTLQNVTVYCGSRFGNDPAFAALAGELGEALGKKGFTLYYGGGTVGLMGILADAAMAAGGKVIGVIPRVFVVKEQAHRGITRLLEVEDMSERKRILIERGDAFVVLPGGAGTLEEFADTFSHCRIYGGEKKPPIILCNAEHIYDPLKEQLRQWVERGFLDEADLTNVHFAEDVQDILHILCPEPDPAE